MEGFKARQSWVSSWVLTISTSQLKALNAGDLIFGREGCM